MSWELPLLRRNRGRLLLAAILRITRRMLKTAADGKLTWAGRIPLLKPGRYADGLPFHEMQYLCCKLVLRPNRFRSRQSLFDFAKVLRDPAEQEDVTFSTGR